MRWAINEDVQHCVGIGGGRQSYRASGLWEAAVTCGETKIDKECLVLCDMGRARQFSGRGSYIVPTRRDIGTISA